LRSTRGPAGRTAGAKAHAPIVAFWVEGGFAFPASTGMVPGLVCTRLAGAGRIARKVFLQSGRQGMDEQRPWHRYFVLSLMDFFENMPVTVEPEKDLSVKKQLLDALLVCKDPAKLSCRLPDGFENLGRYNLVTFKSYQEKLSVWALLELGSQYVNLRKQVSP